MTAVSVSNPYAKLRIKCMGCLSKFRLSQLGRTKRPLRKGKQQNLTSNDQWMVAKNPAETLFHDRSVAAKLRANVS